MLKEWSYYASKSAYYASQESQVAYYASKYVAKIINNFEQKFMTSTYHQYTNKLKRP